MLCNKKTKLNTAIWLTIVALAVLSLPAAATAQDVNDFIVPDLELLEEPDIFELPQMPGTTEGTGTSFEVTDSEYLNITFESTEPVQLRLESLPRMITMHIQAETEAADSTQITLGGFEPDTTYYMYQDGYHNLNELTTDQSGVCTYTQDLTESHLVFIQPNPSTIILTDTGWHLHAVDGPDPLVGTWNEVTRTAKLKKDVEEAIYIYSDDITLEGNGHSVIGTGSGNGVSITGSGVTINDLNIEGFTYGIYIYDRSSISNNTISNNTISNCYIGIYSHNYSQVYSNSTFSNNTISTYKDGIHLFGGQNDTISNNTISNITSSGYGIYIEQDKSNVMGSSVTGNTVSGYFNGIYLHCRLNTSNTLTDNTVLNSANLGIGVFGYSCTLDGNTAINNKFGIHLAGSNHVLRNNTISGSQRNFYPTGILESFDVDTTNTVDGKPIYYIKNSYFQVYDSTTNAGVFYAFNCQNITIKDLTLADNHHGVYLQNTRYATIENVTASNNYYGMTLSNSDNCTLLGNTVSGNGAIGIFIDSSSSNSTLKGNAISGSMWNFNVGYFYDSHDIDTTNTVEGKPIYYVVGASNQVYDSTTNAGVFYAINCDGITIKDLTLTDNSCGVFLQNTHNSTIKNVISSNSLTGIRIEGSNNTAIGNTASGNMNGIILDGSNHSVAGNNVFDNSHIGIYLAGSNHTVTGNTASNNKYGIRTSGENTRIRMTGNTVSDNDYGFLISSHYNTLAGNIIMNNNRSGVYLASYNNSTPSNYNEIYNNYFTGYGQVYNRSDSVGNVFNLDAPIGGNYWAWYSGPDVDPADGFIDEPFGFGSWQDNLPLVSWNSVDSDGIVDAIENGAANGGDGNADGILDSTQDNVASLPNALNGQYVTLASSVGTLSSVTAVLDPAPPSDPAPINVDFPIGSFDFTIDGLAPDGLAVVTIYLLPSQMVNTYYKYGPTPADPTDHWYEFLYDGTTGAVIFADRIELYFVDGLRGDNDLDATNGIIVDPGAPAIFNQRPIADAGDDIVINIDDQAVTVILAEATDPDADPLEYRWLEGENVLSDWLAVGLSGEADIDLGTLPNFSIGHHALRLEVTDGMATSSDEMILTIQSQPPVVGPITVATDDLVQVGTLVEASGQFSDPDINDSHTATWDWGDGITSDGAVNQTNGTVDGTHMYRTAGVYTITLIVTDAAGDSDEAIFQYVVVYAPGAGFVTGGGWIDSPIGAYTADPSLTGKANFGFVAVYKKDATTPSGQTEFRFRVGDLDFHSDEYQWLVVAGARAQFKGTGTINREGNYGFMLTGIDGDVNGGGGVDKFRIKIWDKDNNDAIVYDNKLSAADDAVPTTALNSGSIIIHKE